MTAPGYLDRLAARARGAAAGVRPRVPGRFEPPAAGVPDLEVVEETAAGSLWPAPQPVPDGSPRSALSQVVGARLEAAPGPSWPGPTVPRGAAGTGTLGPVAGEATQSATSPVRTADSTELTGRAATPAAPGPARAEPVGTHPAAGRRPAPEAPADPLATTPVPSWVEDRPAATPSARGAAPERVDGNAPPAAPPLRAAVRRAAVAVEPAPPAFAPRDAAAAWAGPAAQPPAEAPAPPTPPRDPPRTRPAEVAIREITVRPEATGPAPAPVAAEAETEVPVIEVTIGRVEVRATPGHQDPRRRRSSGRERPPLPLDEYLRRRSGRR